LSTEYSNGLVASCQNGHSFTWGAFTLKKDFSTFFPFGPLVQPCQCCPPSEEDEDEDEDEGGASGFLTLSGVGRGKEGCLGEGGMAGFSDGAI
jgi:hypothetical protein